MGHTPTGAIAVRGFVAFAVPLVVVACTPHPADSAPDSDTVAVGDTDTDVAVDTDVVAATADVTLATCTVSDDNVLRATCTVTLSAPAAAQIAITDGVESARFVDSVVSTDHVIPIWGLRAETTWTFEASAGTPTVVTGDLVTGTLPTAMTFVVTETGAGPSSLVQALAPSDCVQGGWLGVFDAHGNVRWYADTTGHDVDMIQFTPAQTILMIGDTKRLLEWSADGTVLLSRYGGFGKPIHHDVRRVGDRIYTLGAESIVADDGNEYVEDMILELDGEGQEVWSWREHDHIDPTRSDAEYEGQDSFWHTWFPNGIDTWHTNTVFPLDDGDFLISLKNTGLILRIAGDDGSIRWILAGGPDPVIPPTIALVSTGGGDAAFFDQHDVGLSEDGRLTLFDNAHDRALELTLDEDAATATFAREWPMAPLNCPAQSSIFPVGDDHQLVTCASGHVMAEFDAAGAEVHRLAFRCPGNQSIFPMMSRGQPMDLWGGVTAGTVTATRVP
jgi:hypothetical protein